jgi:putative FmdB family regulatory protein
MPTYEYQCKTCGNRFERFQKRTDPAVTECPDCGGAVKKLLHPPAIAFKGSGFYVNDYKPSGGGAAKKDAEEPKAEKPAETKPAAEQKPAGEGSLSGDARLCATRYKGICCRLRYWNILVPLSKGASPC